MFETRLAAEAKPLTILRKTTVVFVIAFLIIGAISAYRAYIQVQRLELRVNDQLLRSGSVIETDILSSGRTHIAVRVELIQGPKAKTLDWLEIRGNELGFFDPRSRQASQHIALTRDMLEGFQAGNATLRATGTGRPQWGRTPPPVVREVNVEIDPR